VTNFYWRLDIRNSSKVIYKKVYYYILVFPTWDTQSQKRNFGECVLTRKRFKYSFVTSKHDKVMLKNTYWSKSIHNIN
jgi:hypothetical protein